jgi:uncharacterized phage protein gp47/JayE
MPFTTPLFSDIRAELLRDLQNLQPDADVAVDSDNYVRATILASAIEGLYQHQQWMVRQIFPDTAESEQLDRHAQLHGITRKAAGAATGSITFSGTPGSAIGAGVEAKTADGLAFVTTASGAVGGGGTVSLAAQASLPGAAGNVAAGTALTLTSPPAGVVSAASVDSMTGGADTEADTDLLSELLDVLRNPPAGGNAYDYRRWAKRVTGVESAFVYPGRRGIGTVDVVVVAAGPGLPSTQLISDVQTYIDEQRPVACKGALVLAPTELDVPVTVDVSLVSGATLLDVTALIETALAEYFNGLNPGETAVKSRIEALVSDLTGVADRVISLPAANVVPAVNTSVVEWCRLGTVTVGLLS